MARFKGVSKISLMISIELASIFSQIPVIGVIHFVQARSSIYREIRHNWSDSIAIILLHVHFGGSEWTKSLSYSLNYVPFTSFSSIDFWTDFAVIVLFLNDVARSLSIPGKRRMGVNYHCRELYFWLSLYKWPMQSRWARLFNRTTWFGRPFWYHSNCTIWS